MDALPEVLRMIGLQGALFLHGRFHEPWCVGMPRGGDIARQLCPGARQLGIVHAVLEGRCWVQLPGEEPLALGAGEVVALPAGHAHLVGSGAGYAPVDPRHRVEVKLPQLAPARYGGDGDGCVLASGWFAYERDVPNPLVAALPSAFRVALRGRASGPWIEQSLAAALHEAAAQPGAPAVTANAAESLFLETLRAYLDEQPPRQGGWLAGLRDPQVGRCLALMHDQPARSWSLELLAQEVHGSRSALADRFTDLVGVPPMKYLQRWRLSVAARLLCVDGNSILRVSEAVGYESEASFSRAFKGQFGVLPGVWRKGAKASASVARPQPDGASQ